MGEEAGKAPTGPSEKQQVPDNVSQQLKESQVHPVSELLLTIANQSKPNLQTVVIVPAADFDGSAAGIKEKTGPPPVLSLDNGVIDPGSKDTEHNQRSTASTASSSCTNGGLTTILQDGRKKREEDYRSIPGKSQHTTTGESAGLSIKHQLGLALICLVITLRQAFFFAVLCYGNIVCCHTVQKISTSLIHTYLLRYIRRSPSFSDLIFIILLCILRAKSTGCGWCSSKQELANNADITVQSCGTTASAIHPSTQFGGKVISRPAASVRGLFCGWMVCYSWMCHIWDLVHVLHNRNVYIRLFLASIYMDGSLVAFTLITSIPRASQGQPASLSRNVATLIRPYLPRSCCCPYPCVRMLLLNRVRSRRRRAACASADRPNDHTPRGSSG